MNVTIESLVRGAVVHVYSECQEVDKIPLFLSELKLILSISPFCTNSGVELSKLTSKGLVRHIIWRCVRASI